MPSITLPPGGGAIRGIDEKLTVGLATGTASLSVPVYTTAGRAGFGPSLTLGYDSGNGNGPFGLGWRLSAPSVTRKTSRGLPRYQDAGDSDTFVLSEAEDLVPLLAERPDGSWAEPAPPAVPGFTVRAYRPRVEAGYARIERWTEDGTGRAHWRTLSRDNVTSIYGRDPGARVADPADPDRVFGWLLELSYDGRGNAISYVYKPEDRVNVPAAVHEARRQVGANRYLKRIRYGNTAPYRGEADLPAGWHFEVVLDYGEHAGPDPQPAEVTGWDLRPDPFSGYRQGFEVRTYRRCRRLLMFHHFPAAMPAGPLLVRSTDLDYSDGADPALPAYSLLTSIAQTGYLRAGGGYRTRRLPPLTLGYSPVALHVTVATVTGDGVANLPGGVDGQRAQWVDLDGEGLPGILTDDSAAWYYRRNISGAGDPAARFEPVQAVASKPVLAMAGNPQLADLHGDGRLCAVRFEPPLAGYHARDEHGGWAPFRPFPQVAAVDWTDPNLRRVDLSGDGLADLLRTEDGAFTWQPWLSDGLAAEGFGAGQRVSQPAEEDAGPALVLATGDSSVYLADISGDGLADLVRIRNGEVSYWPNLGYGRFGAKVSMADPPWFDRPELFDQRRIRLADLDGSGTADLVYLGAGRATVWFNRSGNGWSAPTVLTGFPVVDDVATVGLVDLLGSGTACLVWSCPLPGEAGRQLRYADLMGGLKPYLLTSVLNNLGGETTLRYAPSTRFAVADRLAGRPWATRLPFPVQVVDRRETVDRISRTRLVCTYAYHHGYFDGAEREFGGFGMVEQTDAESLPAASGAGTFTATPPVVGAEFTLPPVRTRTWYHTGAYVGGEDLAAVLAGEYFAGDPAAARLGGTLLPAGASPELTRQACRAQRGLALRSETYAEDGTPAAPYPYDVTEHRYQVRVLQPPAGPACASVAAAELESLTYQYERNPADPRCSHQLTLETDPYGTATRTASVGYPRRAPAIPEQAVTLVSYTEHDVANVSDRPDWYRLGVPVETRGYELTGITPGGQLFDVDALRGQAAAAPVLAYEQAPPGGPAKRLIGRVRTRYRADDLSGPLPAGQLGSLALVERAYRLAMTPGLAARAYAGRATPAEVAAIATGEGGFVDADGDGCWWAPSARTFYSPDPAAPDPAYARDHFYLPRGQVDPFGGVTGVGWQDDLVPVLATDPAGNTTTAEVNLRVLQPWLVTDPNQNRTGVRFDELGMVVATATLGKAIPGKALPDGTDEGDHLDTSSDEAAAGDDPTTRVEYDLAAYQDWAADPGADPDRPVPAWSRLTSRVRHRDPATPWLARHVYTDGLGRVALTKSQAEPGDAPARDAAGRLVRGPGGALTIAPTTDRWVGSGRIVYDNKGNPVKAYEPFFDTGPAYDEETDLVQWGVTPVTRYDPLGRAVRVDRPDGTYTTVGFDPWRQVSSDANDTVLGSAWYAARSAGQLGPDQADAAAKAAAHAGTPAVADLDTLGRTVRASADNGPDGRYLSVLALDITGRTLATTDPLGRITQRTEHGVDGAVLHTASIDAGQRWVLPAADGKPIRGWDSRGHLIRHSYDAARRPVGSYATAGGGRERLVEQVTYGEDAPGAEAANLRGVAYQQRDGAGLASTDRRDFKGNVVGVSRRLLSDPRAEPDWSTDPVLDLETFTASTVFDALDRVVTSTTPDGSVLHPTFNERSLLAAMAVESAGATTVYVAGTDHDAKGQRRYVQDGNGARTTYSYDPDTFRLVRLVTTRPAGGGPQQDGALQDLAYTYDPVGNLTRIADAAQQTVFFANQVIAPATDYTYDAVYRLTRATGREHIGLTTDPVGWDDTASRVVPLPADTQALRNYTETYAYDPADNLAAVVHTAANGGWTRTYRYDEPNAAPGTNRLTSTQVGTTVERYGYDPHGNLAAMPHLSLLEWDVSDRLVGTARQVVNGGEARTTWCRYDTAGQRVRKTTVGPSGAPEHERIYLGGYELYREFSATGAVTLRRHTLVVADAGRQVALVETTDGTPTPAVRYQYGNHLGSASLELDQAAGVISYEEYYPYGATSLQAGRSVAEVSLKRYRFCGRERDEETGLGYHGERYYAAWLGRWTSCDPAGLADSPSAYCYARNQPTGLVDPAGRQAHADDYLDAGVPEQPKPLPVPMPDAITSTGEPIYIMPAEQAEEEHAELPEGGVLPPELASKGLVPTVSNKKVRAYIHQEAVTGAKAAVRNDPIIFMGFMYAYFATAVFSQKKADAIIGTISGPEPSSEVAQGAELYTGVGIAAMMFLATEGAGALRLKLRPPALLRGSLPGRELPPVGTQLKLFEFAEPEVAAVESRAATGAAREIPHGIDIGEVKSTNWTPQKTLNYGGNYVMTEGLDLEGGVQASVRYSPTGELHVDLHQLGGMEEHIGTYKLQLDPVEFADATKGMQFGTAPFGNAVEPLATRRIGLATGQEYVFKLPQHGGADILPVQLRLRWPGM